jgi:hypothetical protein
MIHELLNLAKEISSLSEEELNKEIEKTKLSIKAEEKMYGRASFETNMRAHMLMIPLVFDLRNENNLETQKGS